MRIRRLLFVCLMMGIFGSAMSASFAQAYHVSMAEESVEIPRYSLLRFLQIALEPVGKTLYVWGGGWNEEDTAAGIEALSIGVSPQWERYFQQQNKEYDYQLTRYQIHDGLDCSGYVGWSLYNLLHSVDGGEGYVMKAKDMAAAFAQRGWGSYTPAGRIRDYRAGDIMSSSTHVYIVVGVCTDGSVLLAHSTPPGVQLSGTVSAGGSWHSEAIALAERYMKSLYPEWYQRYQTKALPRDFLQNYSQMRWKLEKDFWMKDDEDLRSKTADEIMRLLIRQ